jgi:hypothetical protein
MENHAHFRILMENEMITIDGGLTDWPGTLLLAPLTIKLIHAMTELSHIAMDYQASLPPNLKK